MHNGTAESQLLTHYRAILESAVDYAIISTDLEGRITSWNAGAKSLLGHRPEEVIGASIDVIFTPEDRAAGVPAREMESALTRGRGTDERWHQRQDGSCFWASGEVMPLRSEDGEAIGFLKILRDRTAEYLSHDNLERTAEELSRSEAKLRLSLDASRTAVWDYDISTDSLSISDELNRILGFAEDARPTMEDVRAHYYPGELARMRALAREVFAQRGRFAEEEFRYVWPSGQVRWLLLRAEVSYDSAGHPVRYSGVVMDVTDRKRTEAALKESEERLRDITDALPLLISYIDAEQRFRFVNKPYEDWFGRPLDQIVGRQLKDVMSPEVYEARRPRVERALAGEPQVYDIDMPRPTGVVHTQVTHVPHHDETGRVIGVYSVVQDISERKQAQKAIEESEARFRQLADFNPSIVWVGDAEGNLSYLNTRWSEFTGVPQEEALARGRRDFVHPKDRPSLDAVWAKSSAAGKPYRLEARLLRHDGQYRWHQIRAVPITGETGKVIGWLGNDSDIHDIAVERDRLARSGERLEEVNRALEESAEKRRRDHDRLWQISQEVMLVRDLEGTILAINPSAMRILGWSEEEMVGRRTSEFLHPEDIELTAGEVGRLATGARTLAFENRYRAKDGNYRLFDWTAVYDGGLIHAVARDITAEREAERNLQTAQEALRQSQKMEAVGQLTGGIAHDFNNLLTGIIGSLDILNRRLASGRTENIQRFMDAAITSANRAATLTQRLLAFGRRQSLDVRTIEVGTLVGSFNELLRRTLGENIALVTQFERGLWHARTDANQLENAILNLVINARDAMPSGGTVTIEARNVRLEQAATQKLGSLQAGEYVALSVSDTGTGMTPDVLQRAFDPFYTTKPIGQGTGLGLSMIYGFANQTGGAVDIDSAVGLGTTVTLYLPRSEDGTADAESGREDAELLEGAGEVVLVVEDDPAVRMLVLEVLGELGYQALEAADARSALPIIESARRIDLLISDVGLPGMNGRVLAEIARKHHADLPVLFVTGYAEGASARSGFLEPGMQMITKPFALDALSKRIRDIIEKR